MNIKRKTYTLEEARSRLQRYCAYQERCHKEVYQKLESMHMIPQAIDDIIVSLIQDNYLNETRYAKTFVRGKFKIKKWGKNRLQLELKKKDIGKINIKLAISEIEEGEYIEVFNALAEKRWLQLDGQRLLVRKKKLMDYLFYRGWESHLVYDKIRELSSK